MSVTVPSPQSGSHTMKINKALLMRLAPLFSLVLLVLFFSFSSPFFFNTENIMTIALQTAVIGIMAIGVTFVIITAGIDLSLGSVVAFSGVAVGIAAKSPCEHACQNTDRQRHTKPGGDAHRNP